MDLTHRFTVPTSVEETWAHLNDIASVAECFPGATVSSVEQDTFSGSVKVKLGPIALVYNGSGTFVEKDEAAHRFVVDAKGKDKRGNGTAGAKVTLTMAPAGEGGGSTDVEVVTDLAITGKPAQFGRGVMQDVSDKLLGQFVECLEQRLSGPGSPSDPVVTEPEPTAPQPAPAPAAGGVAPDGTALSGLQEGPKGQGVSPDIHRAVVPDGTAPSDPQEGPKGQGVSPGIHRSDDSLDLGAVVLPVLARSYWKQAVGVLAGVAAVWWAVSRSRR
jgi:carbon monoxide dehydrogenase subunit G